MPERELWPAGAGSEPVTRISSCDSMTSATSSRSGSTDSYDFLSAEEKECLLFLEETIGSLDAEADSGLPTDTSEPASTPRGFRPLPVTQLTPQGQPEETLTQQGPEPRKAALSSSPCPPEPPGLGLRSGSHSLPRNIHIGRNQSLKKYPAQTNGHFPRAEPGKEQTSQSTKSGPPGAALDLNVVLIPPPEAFQDLQPEQGRKNSLSKGPGGLSHMLPASVSSQKREESSEAMSYTASEKGSSRSPGQPPRPPLAQSSHSAAPLSSGGDPHAGPAPLTAPKPRKLPPNIVLKSSRSSFHSQPQHRLSRHMEAREPSPASSSLQEQRKARKEALEKLGLPQDQDELAFHGSKTSSLGLKEAQRPGQASVPAQPAAPAVVPLAVAAGEKAPASARGSFPMKALAPGPFPSKAATQEPAQEKVAAAKSMPIPIPAVPKTNNPLPQSKPDSGLALHESSIPGLRQMSFKSNTLERSGVGLSSYLAAEKDPSPQTSKSLGKDSFLNKTSPSVLRNSRPRPASLGTGKDFAGIQVGKLADLEQGQSSKRLSYQGQSRDKLPRPPCVSVKISPKDIPDGPRREALKKLGLLKE
ncbi:specifically androgen-regulated gene protein isoform 1-T2 [Thomomys bottae]